jgi:hypothetical protein
MRPASKPHAVPSTISATTVKSCAVNVRLDGEQDAIRVLDAKPVGRPSSSLARGPTRTGRRDPERQEFRAPEAKVG